MQRITLSISSTAGVVGGAFGSAYAASKHGIKGFVDALRIELEHEGVPISVADRESLRGLL